MTLRSFFFAGSTLALGGAFDLAAMMSGGGGFDPNAAAGFDPNAASGGGGATAPLVAPLDVVHHHCDLGGASEGDCKCQLPGYRAVGGGCSSTAAFSASWPTLDGKGWRCSGGPEAKTADVFCANIETTIKVSDAADTENWTNGAGHDCMSYMASGWCANGAAVPGMEWTQGAGYKNPEANCVACGKTAGNDSLETSCDAGSSMLGGGCHAVGWRFSSSHPSGDANKWTCGGHGGAKQARLICSATTQANYLPVASCDVTSGCSAPMGLAHNNGEVASVKCPSDSWLIGGACEALSNSFEIHQATRHSEDAYFCGGGGSHKNSYGICLAKPVTTTTSTTTTTTTTTTTVAPVCTCPHGIPASGAGCPVDGMVQCAVCVGAYHLSSANDCQVNLCSCPHGEIATGDACQNHATEVCKAGSCHGGYFMVGTSCVQHKTCASSHYISSAGTVADDVQCAPITTCMSGHYAVVEATATSNRHCAEKLCTCPDGAPARGEACPAHGTAMCTSCFPGYRLESRVVDGDVKLCALNECTCAHGSAATGALCTAHKEEHCSSCGANKHMVGKVCKPNVDCTGRQYTSKEATATSDRECGKVSTCTHTQFLVAKATKYADTDCQEHAKCGDGTWEEFPGTPTEDATCTKHKVCGEGEFESVVPWLLADRECEPCPPGSYCVDMKKRLCTAGSIQPNPKKSSCDSCEVVDAMRRYGTQGKMGQIACTPIPLDCKAETWGEWGTCTRSCGGGTRTRRRLTEAQLPCNLPVQQMCSMEWGGGAGCHHLVLVQTAACKADSCPIDCVSSEWQSWGTCTATCGGGVSTRLRKVVTKELHGGAQCGPLSESVPCNSHMCGFKPECNAEHVACTVAEVRTGLGLTTARVMRVTHHRANMHVKANYHCQMKNGFRTCQCLCDKQPSCCEHKNRILTNAVLQGNRFEGVADSKACCDMCNNHPDCTSWELVHARSDVQIPGTCVLKGGSPAYMGNPDLQMTTWAGVRAGLTGEKCQPPVYTSTSGIPVLTNGADISPNAGVPHLKQQGVN